MSGVGITYLWVNKEFPPFVRLEGKRGDYKVYTPAEMSYEDALILLDELGVSEQTCNLIKVGDSLHCSNCGGAAAKQSWAYWSYCPNCGAKVIGG